MKTIITIIRISIMLFNSHFPYIAVFSRLIFANKLFEAIAEDDEPKLLKKGNESPILIKSKITDMDAAVESNSTNPLGRTPLVFATEGRRENMAKILIENGADVHNTTSNGDSCLLKRDVELGMEKVVKAMLERGMGNEVTREYDDSALTSCLHLAVKSDKNAGIVKLLCDENVDVDAIDHDGCTPLISAIYWNAGEDVIRALLDAKANVNKPHKKLQTPLHLAVTQYDVRRGGRFGNIVDLILSVRDPVTNKRIALLEAKDECGYTPLLIASIYHNVEAFRSLMAAGANVNTRDKWQNTILHHCSGRRNEAIVSSLLSNGFDVEARNQKEETPFLRAAKYGDSVGLKMLGKYGAKGNVVDSEGKGALHYACESNDAAHLVELASFYGADLYFADKCPFEWTRWKTRRLALNKLLEAGLKLSEDEFTDVLKCFWPRSYEIVENEKFPDFQKLISEVTDDRLKNYYAGKRGGFVNLIKGYNSEGTFALYKIIKGIYKKKEPSSELELRKWAIFDETMFVITEGTYLKFIPLDLSSDIIMSNYYYRWKLERFAWNSVLASRNSDVNSDEAKASTKDVIFSDLLLTDA